MSKQHPQKKHSLRDFFGRLGADHAPSYLENHKVVGLEMNFKVRQSVGNV